MVAEGNILSALVNNLNAWGWIAGLQTRGPETLFVSDVDVLDALVPHLAGSAVQVASVDAFQVADIGGVQEIIFFCRKGERAYAKAAATAYPSLLVSAATYDYLPASIVSGNFERMPSLEESEKAKKKYNVVITAPGSGVGDLTALMQANKLETPQSFICPSLNEWVVAQFDFSPIHYLSRLGDYLGARKIDLLLETDNLARFIDATGLTWRRAFMVAAKLHLNMLYFTRRAKVMQAVELAMSRGAPDGRAVSANEPSTATVDSWIKSLLTLETTIESHTGGVGKMKNITHEDLIGAPDNVLPDVAAHFKRRIAKRPDYRIAENTNKVRDAFAADYTRKLVNRLGLKVSDQGSFVSLSHDLLKSEQ